MAIGSLSELLATMLLMAIPDPIVWVVLFMVALILGFAITKTNGTTAALLLFITVNALANSIGGIMDIVNMIMYVSVGFVIVLALMKIGNR